MGRGQRREADRGSILSFRFIACMTAIILTVVGAAVSMQEGQLSLGGGVLIFVLFLIEVRLAFKG